VTYHAIYERARDGAIWSRFVEFDGIAGSGATVEEARSSLIQSFRFARESGGTLAPEYDGVFGVPKMLVVSGGGASLGMTGR